MDWNEIFYYDETSPSYLRWKVGRYRGKGGCTQFIWPGDVVGNIDKKGYYVVNVQNIGYTFVHRVVWELHNGEIPIDFEIDHDNGVRGDNRICNLKLVTSAQNNRNRKIRADNTVGDPELFVGNLSLDQTVST